MRPGAGGPLCPLAGALELLTFVDTIGFEYGSTSTLLDQGAVDRSERLHCARFPVIARHVVTQ